MSSKMTIIEPHLKSSIARSRWLLTGGFLLAAFAFVALAYFETVMSAVHIWLTRDTYNYAFAVLPIAAFLVWRNREFFRVNSPSPTLYGALVTLAFSGLWFIGAKQQVLELQHLAVSGIFIGLVVSAIGWSSAAHFWLPLGYLFLLAPVGTPLLPFLQEITTAIATAFLGLGQIPFYAEGFDIEVATGKYVVAPGCAGLNFILALATVAPLYCEIMYSRFYKKLIVFGLMMVIVPIANGLRVFGIIAIGEYSNRTIDIAADHLVYGWILFSIVVLLMFWFASRFSDPPRDPTPSMPWLGTISVSDIMADKLSVRLGIILSGAAVLSLLAPIWYGLTAN